MPNTIAERSPEPAAAIEIRLSQPQQLFNSLDPAPFHERDLDRTQKSTSSTRLTSIP